MNIAKLFMYVHRIITLATTANEDNAMRHMKEIAEVAQLLINELRTG